MKFVKEIIRKHKLRKMNQLIRDTENFIACADSDNALSLARNCRKRRSELVDLLEKLEQKKRELE